ncbi:MAG: hypothetical protein O7D93_01605, partial [Acidobacteria bacterium]|nr:hypothetical protein [Acidobacteriota bacterium]
MKVSRRPKVLSFLLTSLLISAFQAGMSYAQRPAGSVIVLRGATVIDGLGNPPLSDAVLVIEGDEIKSILSGGDSDYPAGATILDLRGKFIIPGLIDSHVHWSKWMGELYINHGVTSLLAQADVSQEERRASQTSMSTPRVFHTGGRPQLSPSMTREEVRQAIQEYLKKEP